MKNNLPADNHCWQVVSCGLLPALRRIYAFDHYVSLPRNFHPMQAWPRQMIWSSSAVSCIKRSV